MKAVGIFILIFVATLACASFHPFGDPKRNLHQPRETLLQGVSMSEAARKTLVNKCADCHSNSTHWPLYSRVAPASWLIEHDVVEGRRHLNLSRWKELSADQQQTLEQEIVQQTKTGEMPPLAYRLIHRQAALEPVESQALAKLVPAVAVESSPVTEGDPERGRVLFDHRCTGCHALDADHEGPRLRGVYGRRAASVPGFRYSLAIRKSGVTWNETTLNNWLRDSDWMLPNSAMGFSVPKAQDRSDLIAYLKSLH